MIPSASPAISTIIDTYNSGPYIAQAVESVLQQTTLPPRSEIIVVDDGSTDDTAERMQKYAGHPLVRYFRTANRGQGSAVNTGFEHSTGEIVAFLDGDDLFGKDKFERLLSCYEDPGCHGVFHNVNLFSSGSPQTSLFCSAQELCNITHLGDSFHLLSPESFRHKKTSPKMLTPMSGVTLRRSLGEKLFPIPEAFVLHANVYLYYVALAYHDILYDLRPLSGYRQHAESQMSLVYADDINALKIRVRCMDATIAGLRKHDTTGRCLDVLERRIEHANLCKVELLLVLCYTLGVREALQCWLREVAVAPPRYYLHFLRSLISKWIAVRNLPGLRW